MATLSPFAAMIRNSDRSRYLATLFAPEACRDDLFTLYAFDLEMQRIPHLVREPAMGEIRLQWWREVLEGSREAEASGSLLASALRELRQRHNLPFAAFDRYFDAMTFGFYHDAFPDVTSLEAWAGATQSSLIQMASIILDANGAKSATDASGHAGIVLAIAGILMNLPQSRARGQCFLPQDMLAAVGLDRESFVAGQDRNALKRATDALAAYGLDHHTKALRFLKDLPSTLKPAYLMLGPAKGVLTKAAKTSLQPSFEGVRRSALETWFSILRAAF